jgi:hypothetical protein
VSRKPVPYFLQRHRVYRDTIIWKSTASPSTRLEPALFLSIDDSRSIAHTTVFDLNENWTGSSLSKYQFEGVRGYIEI